MKYKNRTYKIRIEHNRFFAIWNGYGAEGSTAEQACSRCHRMIEEALSEE
jgi:hypothetical protein